MKMVPFLDLKAQYAQIRDRVDPAVLGVLRSSDFVLGEHVAEFERRFAGYCQVEHAVALNSGTSALHLALLAAGVEPGDEVITVSMTFVATTAAVLYVGAKPVFVDVDPKTWTMDPHAIERVITSRTKAILPVHLHGRVAEMGPIMKIAERHGLVVIEDAAQAHGADYGGRRAGSIGAIGCFSFYPGKNLGAYGEGGAAVTNDAVLAHKMRVLRDWGQEGKYNHVMAGFNYRMDAIQGAVLDVKMDHIDDWTERRRRHARQYADRLSGAGVGLPAPEGNDRHVWHVFAIRAADRDGLISALRAAGIGMGIHYPVPVHLQGAYNNLGFGPGDLPVTERLAAHFLSLPMYAELTVQQIDLVAEAVRSAMAEAVLPG
jgi:dTDP-4-amino-4,6-dideoxygalactose transaminase